MSSENDDADSDLGRCQIIMQQAYDNLPCSCTKWSESGPIMKGTEENYVGDYSTRIRFYCPADDRISPVLIYIPGGGWIIFSIDTHDGQIAEHVDRTKVFVIGVDCSLSPEVKYSRVIEEIVSVVLWLRQQNCAEIGIDIHRIAIRGDSAGANLSVATNLRLRALDGLVFAAQVLNYNAYDGHRYRLTLGEMHFSQRIIFEMNDISKVH